MKVLNSVLVFHGNYCGECLLSTRIISLINLVFVVIITAGLSLLLDQIICLLFFISPPPIFWDRVSCSPGWLPATWPIMTLNTWSSCLCLSSAEIAGIYDDVQPWLDFLKGTLRTTCCFLWIDIHILKFANTDQYQTNQLVGETIGVV